MSEVVPGTSLRKRGQQIAEKMLQSPAAALRETKRLVHLDEGSQPKIAYRADTEASIRCLELPDAQEGLAAFAEKHQPRFGGRKVAFVSTLNTRRVRFMGSMTIRTNNVNSAGESMPIPRFG